MTIAAGFRVSDGVMICADAEYSGGGLLTNDPKVFMLTPYGGKCLGGQPATVTYSGLVPGGIGYHQLNIIVPGVPPADINRATSLPVTITVSLSNQKDYSAFVQVLQ
jgi:uncharacterized protein (TIGR03437 family)